MRRSATAAKATMSVLLCGKQWKLHVAKLRSKSAALLRCPLITPFRLLLWPQTAPLQLPLALLLFFFDFGFVEFILCQLRAILDCSCCCCCFYCCCWLIVLSYYLTLLCFWLCFLGSPQVFLLEYLQIFAKHTQINPLVCVCVRVWANRYTYVYI